jgi:serine/threonine protein kinase
MDKVNIVFQGNEEILKVVNNGSSIVKLLGYPHEKKCSLIGAEISLGNRVGKGAFGEVYLITFPGMGTRKYVIKAGEIEFEVENLDSDELIQLLTKRDLTWEDIKPLQTARTIRVFENGETDHGVPKQMAVVIPPNMCLITKNAETFQRIPQGKVATTVTVPVGSYLCDTNVYSEYVIGVYTGKLYREGLCANFFDVHSMFTCPRKKADEFMQYIVMDKIDGDLMAVGDSKLKDPVERNSVYIQTLMAIACYQKKYQLSHNDLHAGNVFIEYIKNDTMYNNQDLSKATWFHYNVSGYNIYFPAGKIIVKIGDYGLSVKYSTPIVGDKYVFETGYDQNDGGGPWIPNVYMPQYDSFFFTGAYIAKVAGSVGNSKLAGPLITDCMEFMCPDIKRKDPNHISEIREKLMKKNFIRSSNGRPILDNLNLIKPVMEVIQGPIYQKYGKMPMSAFNGEIVTLGVF